MALAHHFPLAPPCQISKCKTYSRCIARDNRLLHLPLRPRPGGNRLPLRRMHAAAPRTTAARSAIGGRALDPVLPATPRPRLPATAGILAQVKRQALFFLMKSTSILPDRLTSNADDPTTWNRRQEQSSTRGVQKKRTQFHSRAAERQNIHRCRKCRPAGNRACPPSRANITAAGVSPVRDMTSQKPS